jgi:DNA repair exonuclease SbcCD ATPase subunit
MADTTWGVKVPEELKEKLSQVMQGSGLSGKDFVESMLQAYIIQEMSENQPIMAPDLKELQVVTNRIVAIYANLGERLSNVIADKDNWFNAELEKKEKSINVLGEKISALESSLSDANTEKEEAANYALELKKQKKDLEESLETHRALVTEYKEKNDTLTGMLADYNDQKKKYEQIRDELAAKEAEVQQLAFQIEGKKKDIEILNKEIEGLKASHKEAIETLKAAHKETMERMVEKMELEKERAILEIRSEYQNRLEEVRVKSADRIETLFVELQEQRTKKATAKLEKEKEQK